MCTYEDKYGKLSTGCTCQSEDQVETNLLFIRQLLLTGRQTILVHPIISMLVNVIHRKHINSHDLYENLPRETLRRNVGW